MWFTRGRMTGGESPGSRRMNLRHAAVPNRPSLLILSLPNGCHIVIRSTIKIDPFRFLAGCRKRWQNEALSGLLCFVLSTMATLTALCCFFLYSVSWLFWLGNLSVPVQVIDWKDSSPKWPIASLVSVSMVLETQVPVRYQTQ